MHQSISVWSQINNIRHIQDYNLRNVQPVLLPLVITARNPTHVTYVFKNWLLLLPYNCNVAWQFLDVYTVYSAFYIALLFYLCWTLRLECSYLFSPRANVAVFSVYPCNILNKNLIMWFPYSAHHDLIRNQYWTLRNKKPVKPHLLECITLIHSYIPAIFELKYFLVAICYVLLHILNIALGQEPACRRDSECTDGERCIISGDLGRPGCMDGKYTYVYTYLYCVQKDAVATFSLLFYFVNMYVLWVLNLYFILVNNMC